MKQFDPDKILQASGYPKMGAMALPREELGEKETSYLTLSLPYGLLLAVGDGHGRDADTRREAVRIALQSAKRVLQNARLNPDDSRRVEEVIRQALLTANGEVHSYNNMGPEHPTSAVSLLLVLVARGRAFVGHVGNCRLYLVRGGSPNRMTRDHTTAQNWIDHGIMTDDQARSRPEAHSVTRALGEKQRVEPEVRSLPIKLERGDVLMLASAAIHRHLDDDEMGSMAARLEPEHACQELCEVASLRGKSSECKVVIYQSGPPKQGKHPRLLQKKRLRRRNRTALAAGSAAIAVVLLIWAAVTFLPRDKRPTRRHQAPAAPALAAAHAADIVHQATPDTRPEPDLIPAPQVPDAVSSLKPDAVSPLQPDASALRPDAVASLQPPASSLQPDTSSLQPDTSSLQPDTSSLQPDTSSLQPDTSSLQPDAVSSLQPPASGLQPDASSLQPPCSPTGLSGPAAKTAEDIRYLVDQGMDHITGHRKDASQAARHSAEASELLADAPAEVVTRCTAPVEELRRLVRERYLTLARVASGRAMAHLDEKSWRCKKALRMAADARKFGASDAEVKAALRVCGD